MVGMTALPERHYRGSYLQGQFVAVSDPSGEVKSFNPGNLNQAPLPIEYAYAHVQEAVASARRAFVAWKAMAAGQRLANLRRYFELLQARSETLAQHLSFEVGKPLWESRLEIDETLQMLSYFLGLGAASAPEKIEDGFVRHHARGVMAVIPPGSMPVYGAHWHFFPCLVYGNTVVLKASQVAPLTGQYLAEIAHESGLPPGVFNLVQGESELARRLTLDREIDGVFFTGHYETGLKIQKQIVGDYWKVCVVEVVGKNSILVWDDADYPRALRETLFSSLVTTGQRTTSASRVLVHEKLFDKFLTDFHALAKKCRIGLGLVDGDGAPFLGPLMNETIQENYLRYQGIAIREGCEEIMRGKSLDRETKGFYVSPSIHLVNRPDPKSVYQQSEVFGPNVAFCKVRDLEEAKEWLNLPEHGLVASVYSASRDPFTRLADEVHVGLMHWNRPTTAPTFTLPSAGQKKSGNHRPMGSFSVHQCTYPVAGLEAKSDGMKLPTQMPS